MLITKFINRAAIPALMLIPGILQAASIQLAPNQANSMPDNWKLGTNKQMSQAGHIDFRLDDTGNSPQNPPRFHLDGIDLADLELSFASHAAGFRLTTDDCGKKAGKCPAPGSAFIYGHDRGYGFGHDREDDHDRGYGFGHDREDDHDRGYGFGHDRDDDHDHGFGFGHDGGYGHCGGYRHGGCNTEVPLPAALLLFCSGLVTIFGLARQRRPGRI